MNRKKEKQIDLLHGSIPVSLTTLALPIMATAMVQMAYNLTDMAWIGILGSDSVAAVGAAGMFTWFASGVGVIAKMGGQVTVAHALGAGDENRMLQCGKGAIQLSVFLSLVYGILSLVMGKIWIGFFHLQSKEVIENATIYLYITCGLIIFSFLNQILTGLFTAIGDSKTPFFSNCIGLAVNMILDPILILGLFGIPKMGVTGAAIATVIAQSIVTCTLIYKGKREEILLKKIKFFEKTKWKDIISIIKIGVPAGLQNMLYCGISMILTRFVTGYGEIALATQRVGGQVESISWMAAEGFGAAINAFVGQNFGAKQYERVKKGYKIAVIMMGIWGLITTAILILGAKPIYQIFIHEAQALPYGLSYLRIIGVGQFFMCIELLTVGALSGMGKTFLCSIISVLLTGARIPLALICSYYFGLDGIWWALTISSIIKGIVFFFTFYIVERKIESHNEVIKEKI